MKRAQIHALCDRLGLYMEVSSAGDSRSRYYFHDSRTKREIHVAKGRANALTFLAGFEAGLDRELPYEEMSDEEIAERFDRIPIKTVYPKDPK